jgi:hypothetical protein
MTKYNVHIYREMRLLFERIEAETLEAAAAIAHDKPADHADTIDDSDGETFYACVDVLGDEEYLQSRWIDFEPERHRQPAARMLAALRAFIETEAAADECQDWRWEHLEHAFKLAHGAVAEADSRADGLSDSGQPPARFLIQGDRGCQRDRLHVLVDAKFDVAIIRTNDGLVVDVYAKDGSETVASTYAFESQVQEESAAN